MKIILITLLFVCSTVNATEKVTVFQLGDDPDLKILLHCNEETGDSMADDSGHGHTAVEEAGSVTLVSGGKFGGMADYDSGDMSEITKHADFNTTTDFSVGYWVNLDVSPPAANSFIFLKISDVGAYNWVLAIYSTGNVLWRIYGSFAGGFTGIYLNGDFSANTWHYVVGTFNASTPITTVYVDGSSIGSDAEAGTRTNTDVDLHISGLVHASPYGLIGQLDEIFYIDRCLSAAEIKEIYTKGQKVHVN